MKGIKIKIFVAHHKPGYIYEDDVYIPIQVGKKNSKIDLGILGDDTGDNISHKNSQYAELTAQYWVWKNYDLSDVDYVGFCHYRRYMTYCYKPNIFNHLYTKKNPYTKGEDSTLFSWKFKSIREYNHICKFNGEVLKKNSQNIKGFIKTHPYDVYTPKRLLLIGKLLKIFGIKHRTSATFGLSYNEQIRSDAFMLFMQQHPDWQNVIKGVEEECREYYMLTRHLFVMKKEYFLMYMEWLFGFLFNLETLLKHKKYDGFIFHERFMAIFSEPLITYWIYYMKQNNNVKISSKSNKILFI